MKNNETKLDSNLNRVYLLVAIIAGILGVIFTTFSFIKAQSIKGMHASSTPIPLKAGWKPEGPGSAGGGFKDGDLRLRTNLNSDHSNAGLFLDLRNVRLSKLKQNPSDRSYNLAGRYIVATVSSDKSFKGDSSRPNGAQIFLKNKQWMVLNASSSWLNVDDTMIAQSGMKIYYQIPNEQKFAKITGISLNFAIGFGSTSAYKGSFFVKSVRIR